MSCSARMGKGAIGNRVSALRKEGFPVRLLVADDERDLALSLRVILTHAGYEVDVVHDGAQALARLAQGGYDAVVLDVMMPEVSGLDVVSKMRGAGDGTPVILLTARSTVDDRVEGLDRGANDYLVKPFAAKELLARIRAVTRDRAKVTSSTIHCGDFVIDREAFCLRCGDRSIDLTALECKLLTFLVENSHRKVSGEELKLKVWGVDCGSDMGSVWVNMSNLRRKLRDAGSCMVVCTVRGVGYRLESSHEHSGE